MPEQGPDWFLVATEACGGGTPDLGYVLEVWIYIRGVGVGNKLGGVSEVATRSGGAPRGVGAPSTLVEAPLLFWPNSFVSEASSGP